MDLAPLDVDVDDVGLQDGEVLSAVLCWETFQIDGSAEFLLV